MMRPLPQAADTQRGATLIVALVMLTLLTLMALTAIKMSSSNFKIISNAQFQQDATSAAQTAINTVLSKGSYLTEPTTTPPSLPITVNNYPYTVILKTPCLRSSRNIDPSELSSSDRQMCTDSSAYDPSMPNKAGTLCARTIWQVEATVNDVSTKANVHLTQGAARNMDKIEADLIKQKGTYVCS